jgi:hypothetical protein
LADFVQRGGPTGVRTGRRRDGTRHPVSQRDVRVTPVAPPSAVRRA